MQRVFSVSMNAHMLIIGFVFVLAETIGLWFFNNKLNIPANRVSAANYVYQFSIFALGFRILSIPYQATIVAYEKMSLYAWVSIFEVVLKLIIVLLLVLFLYDKLILYSILTLCVVIVIYFVYFFCCRKIFECCHYLFIQG